MTTANLTAEQRAALPERVAQAIDGMVRILVERFEPEQIILFGSCARGTAGPDSDVDLMVVMPVDESTRRQPDLKDVICFHAQQCCEKYLKAVLVARQMPFQKTHVSKEIFALMPADVHLGVTLQDVEFLDPCAVDLRYKRQPPVDLDAVVAAAAKTRTAVRAVLSEFVD